MVIIQGLLNVSLPFCYVAVLRPEVVVENISTIIYLSEYHLFACKLKNRK